METNQAWTRLPTGYFTHDMVGSGPSDALHPERPERLEAIETRVFFTFDEYIDIRRCAAADSSVIELAHDAEYVESLRRASRGDEEALVAFSDPNAPVFSGTFEAAAKSVGAVVEAVDALFERTVKNAFCGVRPPGHHASRNRAGGFCYFNNAAVGALYAIKRWGLKKVAILDFDAHHGDGTEEIVAENPNIRYASLFQWPLYPHRRMDPTPSNVLVSPLEAGAGSIEWRQVVEEQWLPMLARFEPELIILSSGFDAHREETMAQLTVSESDYSFITRRILEAAGELCEGRVASILEGGYSLGSLGRSVLAHLSAMVSAGR